MSEYPQYPTDPNQPPQGPAYGAGAPTRGARPAPVSLAVNLLWAAIALYLVGAVLNLTAGDSATSSLTGAGLTPEQADAAQGMVLAIGGVVVVLLGGLFVLLTVFIGKGANWARITTTVLTAIGVLLTLPSLFAMGSAGTSVLSSLLSLVQTLLCVAAVVLCFRPESSAWFKAR